MVSDPETELELPLLRTKISAPLLPSEFVHRPRLTDRINQGIRGPLTLLSAPAGFGKTHLLVDWMSGASGSIAWLTLDTEDNDLLRFFRYLIGTLQQIDPQLGEETLDLLQSTGSRQLEIGLGLLINEIADLPRDVVLVLDEYHVLEAPEIDRSLNFFLRLLPPNLHLVIASRSEPPLDIAFLRSKRWLVELRADDLRFTRDEIALFLEQTMELQLPPETVTALEKITEGWVTGLQLAAISLRNQVDPNTVLRQFQGDAHYLVDFLAEEVLNRQPEEVQQFLLRSSILDVLSGPLCEALLEADVQAGYGARMLDRLEHDNLFISPLDVQHEWYRYHRLFADFLRHVQVETQPTETPRLHMLAAVWFEQHGNLDEAFKHAYASGDNEWAAELFGRNIETMIKAGELLTLTRWIRKLPDEVIHRHPLLALAYAWGLISASELDLARFWIEAVQQMLESLDPSKKTRIRGWLAICRSMLALLTGEHQQAAEYSQTALECFPKDNPFISSLLSLDDSLYSILLGDTSRAIDVLRNGARNARNANNLLVLIVVTCELAEMYALQGQLSQALATLQKAQLMALGPDGDPLALSGIVDNTYGEILRERNQLKEAREVLERGCRLTQAWWSMSSLDGMLSLACVLQSMGDFSGAQALLTEASRLALSTESSQWDDLIVSMFAVRLALQRNDLTAAARWWKKSGLLPPTIAIHREQYPYAIFEYLLLIKARFHLARGQDSGDEQQIRRTLELLESIVPEVEQYKRITTYIEILVLQAIAEEELGEREKAAETFLTALALGEPEGYRRIYLDEGRPVDDLLTRCRVAQQESSLSLPSPQYIESLLEEIGTAASDRQEHSSSTPVLVDGFSMALSNREMEVLSLIAEGWSNREIAEELCLALNTVKRHAYNIYAKLEVKNRTEAASKARQLELIP